LPFAVIDSSFFECFCEEAGIKLQSEGSVTKLLQPLYSIVLTLLEDMFRECGFFSLTFDLWTSLAKQKYLAVTFHSTTPEFELLSFPLDLIPFGCSA
jgi:hypothetical protein